MNDFFANMFEILTYFDDFSGDVYDQGLYTTIGFCVVLIPVIALTIYYYAVNSVSLSKWWHWLLLVTALCGINFLITLLLIRGELTDMYDQLNKLVPYSTEFINLALISLLWTFVISCVWSLIIKWGSKNCSRTPF